MSWAVTSSLGLSVLRSRSGPTSKELTWGLVLGGVLTVVCAPSVPQHKGRAVWGWDQCRPKGEVGPVPQGVGPFHSSHEHKPDLVAGAISCG